MILEHLSHQKVTLIPSSLQTAAKIHSSLKHLRNASLQSDFLRKTSGTMIAKVIIGSLGAVSSILLARLLGPEARGTFGIALQLSTLGVQIGCLGIHSSNLFYSAKDSSKVPVIVGNSLLLSVVLGIVVILLMSGFFYAFPDYRPLEGDILTLALLWVPIGIAYLLVQNILPGVQDIKGYNYSEIAFRIIGVLLFLIVIALFKTYSIEVIYSTTFIPPLLVTIWVVWKLRKYGKISVSFKEMRLSISYATRIYIAMIFAFVMLRANLFMIKDMLSVKEAGIYSVVMNLSDLFSMISVSFGMILFAKSSSLQDNVKRWNMTLKSALLCSVILLITFAIYYLNDSFIINTLYGIEFESAVTPSNYLLIGMFCMGIQTIFMQYLASIGLPKITLYLWGLGAGLAIVLNYIFIPKFGLNGASIASSITYGVFAISVMICAFYYGKKDVIKTV